MLFTDNFQDILVPGTDSVLFVACFDKKKVWITTKCLPVTSQAVFGYKHFLVQASLLMIVPLNWIYSKVISAAASGLTISFPRLDLLFS